MSSASDASKDYRWPWFSMLSIHTADVIFEFGAESNRSPIFGLYQYSFTYIMYLYLSKKKLKKNKNMCQNSEFSTIKIYLRKNKEECDIIDHWSCCCDWLIHTSKKIERRKRLAPNLFNWDNYCGEWKLWASRIFFVEYLLVSDNREVAQPVRGESRNFA